MKFSAIALLLGVAAAFNKEEKMTAGEVNDVD